MDCLECKKVKFCSLQYHNSTFAEELRKHIYTCAHIDKSELLNFVVDYFPLGMLVKKRVSRAKMKTCTCDLNFFKGSISTSVDIATKTFSKCSECK